MKPCRVCGYAGLTFEDSMGRWICDDSEEGVDFPFDCGTWVHANPIYEISYKFHGLS